MSKKKTRRSPRRGTSSTSPRISRSGSAVMDNMKVALLTKDNWIDMAWAVAGGAVYVLLPTAIQRIGVRVNAAAAPATESTYTVKWWDVNGWPMNLIGTGGGLLLGAVMRQPGFMAGVIGTSMAHVLFTKLNKPLIKRVFGIYAARLDASSTSTMGDNSFMRQPPALQPGASMAKVGGQDVVLYPRAALPQNVTIRDNHKATLQDNHKATLQDNHRSTLADNHAASLRDGHSQQVDQRDGWDANPLSHF